MKLEPTNADITFHHGRNVLLNALRDRCDKLQVILTDPYLTNEAFKPLVEECQGLADTVKSIIKLNNAFAECASAYKKLATETTTRTGA